MGFKPLKVPVEEFMRIPSQSLDTAPSELVYDNCVKCGADVVFNKSAATHPCCDFIYCPLCQTGEGPKTKFA